MYSRYRHLTPTSFRKFGDCTPGGKGSIDIYDKSGLRIATVPATLLIRDASLKPGDASVSFFMGKQIKEVAHV